MRVVRICMKSCFNSFHSNEWWCPMKLSDLSNGARSSVRDLVCDSGSVTEATLRRLAELGFIEGEPVQVLRRGPGGKEPLAVQVGDTLLALRLVEARCVEVNGFAA